LLRPWMLIRPPLLVRAALVRPGGPSAGRAAVARAGRVVAARAATGRLAAGRELAGLLADGLVRAEAVWLPSPPPDCAIARLSAPANSPAPAAIAIQFFIVALMVLVSPCKPTRGLCPCLRRG